MHCHVTVGETGSESVFPTSIVELSSKVFKKKVHTNFRNSHPIKKNANHKFHNIDYPLITKFRLSDPSL